LSNVKNKFQLEKTNLEALQPRTRRIEFYVQTPSDQQSSLWRFATIEKMTTNGRKMSAFQGHFESKK
jgi:hypothetical protein